MVDRIFLLFAFLCFWPAALPASALAAEETLAGDHVRIRWLAPDQFAQGKATTIGIYFEVDPHWHVYWRNAGDSGAAPRFVLRSDQADVGPVQWPAPTRLQVAHLTNLGYEGNVAYLFDVKPHAGEPQLILQAELEWLVCQEECIPGFGVLTLTRPLASEVHWNPEDQELLQDFATRIPAREPGPWQIEHANWRSREGLLRVQISGGDHTDAPEIFPLDGQFLTASKPLVESTQTGWVISLNTLSGVTPPAQTGFVLTTGDRSWEYNRVPVTPIASAPPVPQTAPANLAWLLLFAITGGVLLNLMPCVFPVLFIKLFGLVNSTDARHRLREGVLYTLGVLMTFVSLGVVFLALRAGGAAVGWGFQLQSPVVVLALALLFWLMGLSFLGAFEFGHRLMELAGCNNSRSAFITGVLAVFVAAPCTGPFMGAALGASATLPAPAAMAIFVGLGAGLALPFLILSASPGLAARLPRPGPWMETLRQLLAFPLFATVLWLLWVLSKLVEADAWLTGASLLLLITFALWLGRSGRRSVRAGAWLLSLCTLVVALQHLRQVPEPVASSSASWQPYSLQALTEARQGGQAVFIDFTAAWCITCQVNKKLVLETAEVERLFDRHQVLRLRADWTSYDARITAALAEFGRNSVPVYVFYPAAGGNHSLLPQILTPAVIRDLFE